MIKLYKKLGLRKQELLCRAHRLQRLIEAESVGFIIENYPELKSIDTDLVREGLFGEALYFIKLYQQFYNIHDNVEKYEKEL